MRIKKLPIVYQIYGYIIRNIFDFRWKSRLTNPLLEFIKRLNESQRYYCYVKYVDGIKIRLDLRDWIPQLIFVWGDYVIERNATNYFKSILKPGMVFVDIGANIGYYSLIASVRVGNTGRVFSFEPVSRNKAILEENIRLNNLSNITIIPKAVSNEELESVKIYLAKDDMCGMGSLKKLNEENYTNEYEYTNTITFQNFLDSYKPERIDVIKIDVEGSELNVLKGMSNFLSDKKTNPVILIELTKWSLSVFSATIKDVIDFMLSYGFKAFKVDSQNKLFEKTDFEEEFLCIFKRDV